MNQFRVGGFLNLVVFPGPTLRHIGTPVLYENYSAIQKHPLGLDFCLIVGQDKNELTIIGVLPTFSDAAHTLLRNQLGGPRPCCAVLG